MTRQQIDILIKDRDIWLESSPEYGHSPKASFINFDNGEIYVVSDELYSIIERVFQDKLNFESEFEHEAFKKSVQNRIELISPLKQDRTLFYKELLKEQNNQLTEILSGNFYNSIHQLISTTFYLLFHKNGMSWIECLKFEVLRGKKLDTFSLQGNPNNKYIRDHFNYHNDSMPQLFEIATIDENIKYLKNLIAEIEYLGESELGHTDIAVLCILKNLDLIELTNCRAQMKKYNAKLSEKQAPKLRNKYYDLLEQGSLVKTKYSNTASAKKVISSLKKIMIYLSDTEKTIANNTIHSIEANI